VPINFKKLHGFKLVDAGYLLVPIKAGEKFPTKKGWPKLRANRKDVQQWINTSFYNGLGVLGEFNPGVDIDVQDEAIVKKLSAWCMENIGAAPIRTGNAPRVLIPYAAPPGGLGPDNSSKYEDCLGGSHQIEIKAAGQQWVAYGVHPTTKRPYTWTGGELHAVDSDFLPTLTGAKIDALFKYFESIIPDDWEMIKPGRRRRRVGGVSGTGQLTGVVAFENYQPPLNIEADRLRSMLTVLNPDSSHDEWLMIGMALYHQFEGGETGKQLFIEWSKNSVEFDEDEIEARWPTWSANTYQGKPITAATIVSLYNEVTDKSKDPTRRPKSKFLSDWERRFCLVELTDGSEVHDAGVPLFKAPRRTLKAFTEHNAAYWHQSVEPDGTTKIEAMVTAWKASKNTRHFAGYTYQPGKPRFTVREGSYGDDALYVNTFYFPPHKEIEEPRSYLYEFNKFMDHLFPADIERAWIIEWLARLIQNPSVRSFVTPISITSVTGTGRGIFFEILRALIGGHNCHDVSRDDIEGRFNNFLDKCIVAVVQEIKTATGDRKYQMWEKMKSLLADTSANIQAKGQDSYTSTVYANFLMFSNNLDALPLDDVHERRVYAMRGAYRPLNTEEIDEIIEWKNNDENIAALFTYLKSYEVSDAHFKRAPVSETKVQMVNANLGAEGSDLVAWLTEEAPLVFDFEFATEALENFSNNLESAGMSRARFSRALADRGYHSARIRVADGRRVYVYFHPATVEGTPESLKKWHNKPKSK